ncbi:hypothetical protein [Magnetospira sp. QH-2]|uniref:hypothetical protein n=1 Tax=Magnetospira sp. (strain QH-2) TaxID=1288970 RepID=UPI0003E8185E|nr:hypothetical protein [Magnetospira sp. QH-2]CCQ74761.1 protein of unknown function [Magnetospira sp. QH-2]
MKKKRFYDDFPLLESLLTISFSTGYVGKSIEARIAYYRVLTNDEDIHALLKEIDSFLESPWAKPESIKEAFKQAEVYYPYDRRRYKGASNPDNRAIGWIEQIRDTLKIPIPDQMRRNAAKLVREEAHIRE